MFDKFSITSYDAADHYWIVGGDEAKVFSSARGAFAKADDPAYSAWLDTPGKIVTRIANGDELIEVLEKAGVALTFATRAALGAPITSADVKAEAARRIVAIAPEWKQRNMTARSVELLETGKENWTATAAGEAQAMKDIWAAIKAIRTRSDAIEAMDPIPADFTDDKHWW